MSSRAKLVRWLRRRSAEASGAPPWSRNALAALLLPGTRTLDVRLCG